MAKENKNKSFFARCSESIRIKAAGIWDILTDALKITELTAMSIKRPRWLFIQFYQ